MKDKYKIVLIPHLLTEETSFLRGKKNSGLSLKDAQERTSRFNLESRSKTASGRSYMDSYRYNRKFPHGWVLGYVKE